MQVVAVKASNRPLSRNLAGKRCGAIEDVIAWAWREELPKAPKAAPGPEGFRAGWEKTDRFAEHLSLVDLYGVNRFGCVPDFTAESWPHADAVTIGEAVMALDGLALDMPEDWRPAPELDRFGGLGIRAVSMAWRQMTRQDTGRATLLRRRPSDLIVQHAVMGSDAASLVLDDVREDVERWSNGKERWFLATVQDRLTGRRIDGVDETVPTPIEVNGVDRRGKPLPGAYRKSFLAPDPVPVIVARAEHEILVSALAMVAELAIGRLEEIEVLPSRIPLSPWLEPVVEGRVLPDLVAQAQAEEAERDEKRTAFARRYPRWFRNLERAAAKMASVSVRSEALSGNA